MNHYRKALGYAAALLLLALLTTCGGRSLGNNSSDSGVTGTPGTVTTPNSDTTPPTVNTYTPANGAGSVAPNTTLISVTFSEAIDTSTISSSSFHVKQGNTCTGAQVAANAAVATNSNQTFTITLTGALLNSTQYSTCLTSAIKDVAGNSLVATQAAWTTSATADVTAPANVTGVGVQAGLGRLILTWTNPGDADYAAVKILRKTTNDITDQNDATATVACGGEIAAPQTTCTDTGLTDGTPYFYKIFSRDLIPNYASGANGTGTPACGTIEDIRSLNTAPTTSTLFSLSACTLPQVTVTSVHQDGSNMGFYIQQTKSGAGIFVFTASVNPSTTLNLAPGDRITFNAGTWTNLCVTAFNRQLQIVRQSGASCPGSASFTAADWAEGTADAAYLANLGSTISGNVTFSTDYTNGAEGRLYVFSTPVSITGAGDSSTFPSTFGGSTTINIGKTALASYMLANGAQFTPGRTVVGRFGDALELRMYGTGAGGTTNYDGVTAGGGENGFAVKSLSFTAAPTVASSAPAASGTFGITSTSVSVTFDQMMTIATVTTASLKVVAGTDCSAAALTTTGGVANSNNQRTFTITLNNGQLTSGNTYSTCVTTAVQNTSSLALAAAATMSWTASDIIYSTGFETSFSKGGYAAGLTGPTGQQWNFDDALLDGTGNDRFNGSKAPRFNSSNANTNATDCNTNGGMCAEMQFDVYGAQQVRYYCARYGSDTDTNSVQLQSSTNGGTSWTNEGSAVTCAGTTLALKSQTVSFGAANVRFRIIKVTGGRVNIDDFEIRATIAPPTVASSSPASGATGTALVLTPSTTFSEAMTVATTQGAYTIKQTDCSGTVVSVGSPAASGGNAVFTHASITLAPSTTYAHCVTTAATSAVPVAMASAYSATFTTAALAEPTSVTFTPANTQVTVGWTNSSNADTGVKIARSTTATPANCNTGTVCTGAACNATLTMGSAGRTYVDSGLTNGTQYYYLVCANHTGPYLSTGVSGSATPTNADITPPANPGSPTYTSANTQVTLGWNNPADGDFAGIKIVRADGTGTAPADCNSGTTVCTGTGCNANVTAGATGLTYVNTGLTNGTQYAYRMCAYDAIPNMSGGVTGTATPSATTTIYNFTNWTANATAGVYPSGMTFGCTQTLDPTLAATVSGNYTGATNVAATSFGLAGQGTSGISMLNTGTANAICNYGSGNGFMASIDVPINTSGRTNIQVSWNAAQISDQTREYGLRLQYDCGSGYTDVAGPVEFSSVTAGASTAAFNFGPTTLPVACENNATAKLRWRYYNISGAAGSRTRIAIDEILVTGN